MDLRTLPRHPPQPTDDPDWIDTSHAGGVWDLLKVGGFLAGAVVLHAIVPDEFRPRYPWEMVRDLFRLIR